VKEGGCDGMALLRAAERAELVSRSISDQPGDAEGV
jgi:hypothetical protein